MTPEEGPYRERDDRAAELLARQDHAAKMLDLYREVLARQRPLYRHTRDARWSARLRRSEAGEALDLGQLPFHRLDGPFRRFVADLGPAATPELAACAESLAAASPETRQALLRRVIAQGELEPLARTLGCAVPPLVFFARAYLQPVAEALAAGEEPSPADALRRTADADPGPPPGAATGHGHTNGHEQGDGHGAGRAPGGSAADAGGEAPDAGEALLPRRTCPRCGWPPQVSVVRDERDARGRRLLVCALCGTGWPYPRVRCPSCGESKPDQLVYHSSEQLPHLRIEECKTCGAYVKAIDLRRDGAAVPLVDDIASVELDLWADQRGLWKVSRNLLGL